MRQTWAALLSLASIIFAPMLPAMAQDVVNPSTAGVATYDAGIATYDGGSVYMGTARAGSSGGYLYFRKDIDNGVGYREGFSTLGGFVPFVCSDHYNLFFQSQVFVTDDGEWGANVGGGYRYYINSADRVLGVYGFYDTDESPHGYRHDQIAIGFETLGPMWDFRTNGYYPLDRDDEFVRLNALTGPPQFAGYNLILNGTAFFERAMTGGDFEFGFPILDPSAFGRLRTYFGGYVYDAQEKDQAGIRARLEAHLNEHVTLGAAFMHDDVNGDMVTMAVDIRGWSRTLPGLNNREVSNRAKLFLPVVRQYRIAHERFLRNITTPALDENDQPLTFVWVDNSNPDAGDGTFENPFSSTPPAAPGAHYIFVRRGDSSETNPVLGGITLEDNQRLFGEGFLFFVTVSGTEFGDQFNGDYAINSLVPTWNIQGFHPFVSNPGGDMVTLANNNQVGGLNIIGSGGHGITGTGITNFNLFSLNIGNADPLLGNAGAGISLVDATGLGMINNITLLNNAGGGLLINNLGVDPLNLTVIGSTSVTPNVVGGAVGLSLIADDADITAQISNFFNSDSDAGAVLTALNGATLDVTITGGSFDNAAVGDGMQVTVDDATLALSLTNVTADNAAANALNISLTNGAVFTGDVSGTTPGGSSFSGALGGDGVRLIVDNSPAANSLTFFQTAVDGNAADGLHVELTNASLFDLTFTNGTINGNFGDNVDTSLDGGSTLNLLIDPTSMNGAGENGFRFNVVDSSILNATFDRVTIVGSALNGILGTLDTLGSASFVFSNVNVDGSGEHGMFITALGGSTFDGAFTNSTFNDNNQSAGTFDGINLFVDDSGIILNLENVLIGNTFGVTSQDDGIEFLVQNAGGLAINALGGSIETNSGNGVIGEVHGPLSVAGLTFDGTFIDGNGGDGVNLLADTAALLGLNLANASVSNNGNNGVVVTATNAGTQAIVSISNTDIDNNGARGVDLFVNDQALLNATVSGASSASGNALDGFLLTADGAGTIARLFMTSSNQFNNNTGGAGVRVNATNVDEILAVVSGSASGNAQEGVDFNISGVTDTVNTPIAVAIGVSGPGSVNNNGADGIEFNVTGSTINNLFVTGVSANGNALNGVQVNVDNSTVLDSGDPLNPAVLISGTTFNNNAGGSGVDFNFDTVTVPANNVTIGGTTSISGNNVDGIRVNLNASPIDGLRIVNHANTSNNGEHGLHVNLTNSNLTNLEVSGNTFNNNGDAGIEFFGNSDVSGAFDGNTANGNQGEGMAINLAGAQTFTATITGSEFSNNTGIGLAVNTQDISSYSLLIGGPSPADANVFDGNTGAAIGITMRGNSSGFLGIENNEITDTLAAGGPFFFGQGVHVRMFNSSTLSPLSFIDDNLITGNADIGIDFRVQDNATLAGLRIDNNEINNTGDGIRFLRLANGRIGSTSAVQILNNQISEGNNGIYIAARNAATIDSYILNNNTITDAGNVGILIEHGFDAQLNIDMDGNEITGSGGDGINTFQTAGTLVVELRRLFGTWQNLTVTGNTGNGIQLGAVTGNQLFTTPLLITTSTISDNGLVGLHANGPGFMNATFNLIEGNGSHGILVDSAGFKDMDFNNNIVRLNEGDGLRVVNNETVAGFSFDITANNNLIELNTGRGINLLNQGTVTTTFTANGNTINGNGLEGVYIVNTSSTNQSADFNTALLADGAVDEIPRLFLTFNNNTVQGNGNAGKMTNGGGFVLRVGTSDGRTSFTNPGGFADTRGGVVATVSGNTFTGNAGVDVYFDSFTSTVDPATTASSDGWTDQNDNPRDDTNNVFDIDSYRADPLARLDLVFTNNTGDEIDATNPGAFYANDEPVFKSRTEAQDGDDPGPPDDAGPFSTGTRWRNAQRLAARLGLPPTIAEGANYLYPGIGQSTFRVNASGNVFAVVSEGFLLDTSPYNDIFDAFGVDNNDDPSGPFGGAIFTNAIDAMPWGWSILP